MCKIKSASEGFACKLGVRQGECLRNTGAGVTVNDMKIFLLLYTDDAVSVIFSETPTGSQSGINELLKYMYCEWWKFKIGFGLPSIPE